MATVLTASKGDLMEHDAVLDEGTEERSWQANGFVKNGEKYD
jgi:hypothetical protein